MNTALYIMQFAGQSVACPRLNDSNAQLCDTLPRSLQVRNAGRNLLQQACDEEVSVKQQAWHLWCR
jgi:hypothetical protein